MNGDEYMVYSAMMGRNDAIRTCIERNIDYQKQAKHLLQR